MQGFLAGVELRHDGIVCAAAVIGMLAVSGYAQSPPENVARGQALAEKFCTQCHAIVRNGPAGWTDAPSFAAIADRPTTTAAWLNAVIQQPHMHMLAESVPRSRAEANDIAAYILSLRQK